MTSCFLFTGATSRFFSRRLEYTSWSRASRRCLAPRGGEYGACSRRCVLRSCSTRSCGRRLCRVAVDPTFGALVRADWFGPRARCCGSTRWRTGARSGARHRDTGTSHQRCPGRCCWRIPYRSWCVMSTQAPPSFLANQENQSQKTKKKFKKICVTPPPLLTPLPPPRFTTRVRCWSEGHDRCLYAPPSSSERTRSCPTRSYGSSFRLCPCSMRAR